MGELLLQEIENTREEMIEMAKKSGLLASETTNISQKLDALMNQYDERQKNLKINPYNLINSIKSSRRES